MNTDIQALIAQAEGSEEALLSSLPEGAEMENGVISWQETDGFRTLSCALEILPQGGEERSRWIKPAI